MFSYDNSRVTMIVANQETTDNNDTRNRKFSYDELSGNTVLLQKDETGSQVSANDWTNSGKFAITHLVISHCSGERIPILRIPEKKK